MSKEAWGQQAGFAQQGGEDALRQAWEEAGQVLNGAGLDLDTKHEVDLGLRKWSVGRGGHRAVIIRVKNQDKLAFRLELEIDLKDEDRPYIAGTFSCPSADCHLTTDSFTELTNHHLKEHRTPEGDTVSHTCCGREFPVFESFARHVYEQHRNVNAVILSFTQVLREKYDSFLSAETTTFFPQHNVTTSFRSLLLNGMTIMNNFGSYFIFFWNCQDFAAWYLTFSGVPLRIIEPTLPDQITGSGTDSSARSVRDMKGWRWYRHPDQVRRFELRDYAADALCNRPGCEFLPPMGLEALRQHIQVAHTDTHQEQGTRELLYYICGQQENGGLNLDSEGKRRFTIYMWKSRKLLGHVSLVVEPWSMAKVFIEDDDTLRLLQEERPLGYYHTVELRYDPDTTRCSIHCDVIDKRDEFQKVAVVFMPGEALAKLIRGQIMIHGIYTVEEKNCEKFCNDVLQGSLAYQQDHNKKWLATLSPEIEPGHPRAPFKRDPQREEQLKKDFCDEYDDLDKERLKKSQETALREPKSHWTAMLVALLWNIVRKAYANLRSVGLLHPLWVVLLRGFPNTTWLWFFVFVWMVIYVTFRIVDSARLLVPYFRLTFLDDKVPENMIFDLRWKFFASLLVLVVWALALILTIVEVCVMPAKLDSALCLQYTWIALGKFKTALLGQKEDFDLLLQKKKIVSSQRLVKNEVIVSLLNCDTPLFVTFWPMAASNAWLSSCLFVLAVVGSLILANPWAMKTLHLPRLPLCYYTGLSTYNVVAYALYALGIGNRFWQLSVSGESGFTVDISGWPVALLIAYYPISCSSNELQDVVASSQFYQEHFRAGQKALTSQRETKDLANPDGFRDHLKVWLEASGKAVSIFNACTYIMYALALAVWFWPKESYLAFLLVSFIHCLSSFLATRLTSYIHVLTQILTTDDSIDDFLHFTEVFPKSAPPPPRRQFVQPAEDSTVSDKEDPGQSQDSAHLAEPDLD